MKHYHIDFGSWIIEADSEAEAEQKAEELIITGEGVPIVSNVEENTSND